MVNLSDFEMMILNEILLDFQESRDQAIDDDETIPEEIDFLEYSCATLLKIKDSLNETRKIRNFDGWEATLPQMPVH